MVQKYESNRRSLDLRMLRNAVCMSLVCMQLGCPSETPPTFSEQPAACANGSRSTCRCPDGSEGVSICSGAGLLGPCEQCGAPSAVGGAVAEGPKPGLGGTFPRAGDVSLNTAGQSTQLADSGPKGGMDGLAGGRPIQPSSEAIADSTPDVADIVCDEDDGQAYLSGTFRCMTAPEYVTIQGESGSFDIFTYEASHPLASPSAGHPCASLGPPEGPRVHLRAPQEPTEACSISNVRPWHMVTWQQASDACEFIGWRLCSRSEFIRACGGVDARAYPYGSVFRNGACNVRDLYRTEGSLLSSEAPTGYFDDCRSADGLFDMTGNLWEWTNEREVGAPGVKVFMGMGYRTIAERHQDYEMRCETDSRLPASISSGYVNETVGFRCCRDAR